MKGRKGGELKSAWSAAKKSVASASEDRGVFVVMEWILGDTLDVRML